VWERCLTALGIRHRTIYQTKHSYATNALEAGESPAIVASNLGISLATLEKHYAAALRRRAERAVAKTPRKPAKTPRPAKNLRESSAPDRIRTCNLLIRSQML
jgi:integrase